MTQHKHLFGAVAALALTCGAAAADPAIIYDLGGKFDKSFNEVLLLALQNGQPEPVAPLKSWKCNPKPSANKHCGVLAESGANLL